MNAIRTIEIDNIGPVTHATIPAPEEGGITVLKGRNGSGKTRSLEAVEAAISGRGKPEIRDGALTGQVSAFGAMLRLGRTARRSGELEVTSLEGRLSVAELVDPGLKSVDAADAKRIKALVQLTAVQPSPELFYGLLGGRDAFESVVSPAAIGADDLVVMADRIKRDCEAEARKEESKAENADGRAKGAREAAGGVDEDVETDAKVLQQQLEEAIRAESALQAQAKASQDASDAAALARARIRSAESGHTGIGVEQALLKENRLEAVYSDLQSEVNSLSQQLEKARQAAKDAATELSQAIVVRKNEERHEATLAEWKEQVRASIPEAPSEDALAEATAAVTKAKEAMEAGAVARAAKAKIADALKYATEALEHRKAAAKLREAAKGTDEVLSSVVAQSGSPLRVEGGRLVLDTKRGATYFSELSHGERWRIALDIAIKAVGPGGVIVLEQEAWEGLDPIVRKAIAAQVKGTQVLILTAQCDVNEEVTAEVFA